jgi:ankyrin repeat protein
MAKHSDKIPKPDPLDRTPLHYAVVDKNEPLVVSLIESGADINAVDKDGWTPLHFAAQRQFVGTAELLLDAGAIIDAQDGNGNTPLSNAVFSSHGSGDLIRILRRRGANPNVMNKYGVSPIGLAKTIANYNVIQFFNDVT